MASLSITLNNLKKRRFSLFFEKRKKIFQALLKDSTLPEPVKYDLFYKYKIKFSNYSHLNKSSNRCVFTGRSRVIIDFLK